MVKDSGHIKVQAKDDGRLKNLNLLFHDMTYMYSFPLHFSVKFSHYYPPLSLRSCMTWDLNSRESLKALWHNSSL